MRASLESGVFCFNQQYHITATWHFFLGLVWLRFTGSSKIDRNVLQMESRDIIKVVLTLRTTIKKNLHTLLDSIVLISQLIERTVLLSVAVNTCLHTCTNVSFRVILFSIIWHCMESEKYWETYNKDNDDNKRIPKFCFND